MDNTQSAKEDVQKAAPEIRTTLLSGVAAGIEGLKSLVFFLAFAMLSTLFVLKDGPVMHRFINRHLGVPEPVANVVTTNIAKSLRSYFLAVTIIAAFNAVLIGGAALILGVPLAGTIAVVTFVGAYVPFVGAWVAGGFAVLIALSTGSTSDALIMAVVALLANGVLQQMIQPFVMGATLSLNPLVVLVVTIGAGALFGMVGLTLAAPLTSAAVHISQRAAESGPGPCRGRAGAGAVRLRITRRGVVAPAFLDLRTQRLPPRARLGGDLVPLAPDLVLGGPFAAPDAVELVVDLAAGRRRADEDDHDAEERRDHGEDRADHAVAGGVGVEEVRDVHRRADRVRREQRRSEDGERDEIAARDPLGAEHPAAPEQEHGRQRRGEQRRGELEAAAPQRGVDAAAEREVSREPADPEQPVERVADAQRARAPRSARTAAARRG